MRHAAVPRARGDRLARLARGYNSACDLWSLGVILYVLLCGYTPFDERVARGGGPPPSIFDQIQAGIYPEEHLARAVGARLRRRRHLVTSSSPSTRGGGARSTRRSATRGCGSSAAPSTPTNGDDDAIEEASSDEDKARRRRAQPGGKAGASSSAAMGGGRGGGGAQAAEARGDADGTSRRPPNTARCCAARAAAGVAAARLRVGPRVQAADRPARPPERERWPKLALHPAGGPGPPGGANARGAVLVMMSSLLEIDPLGTAHDVCQ